MSSAGDIGTEIFKAVGTDECRSLGRPCSSCLIISPVVWRALAIPARAAKEMVRGRGQHGEFPRLQLAWGDSNQMETVSNSEDIAPAVW